MNTMCANPTGLHLQAVEEFEVAGRLGGPLDSLAQGHGAGATLGPVGAAHSVEGPSSFGYAAHQIQLSLRVSPGGRDSKCQR